MILFRLFITFFEIGLFTFGGGYAMIALVRDKVLEYGWLTEDEFINMIAVSESTPGPIAINMATFVGSNEAGFFGSVLATLGVVLPSFIIILIISSLLANFLKYKAVNSVLKSIRPAVVALILGTGITMFMSNLLAFDSIKEAPKPSLPLIAIFVVIAAFANIYKKLKGKKPSAILLILISAALGILIFSFI